MHCNSLTHLQKSVTGQKDHTRVIDQHKRTAVVRLSVFHEPRPADGRYEHVQHTNGKGGPHSGHQRKVDHTRI